MVRTGLNILLENHIDLFNRHRVGLVSHAPSVLPDLTGIVDAMQRAGANLTALFGPEHGFTAVVADGEAVENQTDARTGLPVYSLYGETREPSSAMLEGLDLLVLDFQDVGVRFYTYLSTLFYVLRAAGTQGIPVLVLDRPNPINGLQCEGPLIEPGYESFVGIVGSLPVRHGMTMGELALMLNDEYKLNAPLTVIPMQGWSRQMWFDQTRLPWVFTSPAMPTPNTTVVYPGTCFIEGTNLSEGRGTALPFELIGAPWIDGDTLSEKMNDLCLPGVRFRPVTFNPSASKHAGQVCHGVQVHVLDRNVFQPVAAGLHLIAGCISAGPEFAFLDYSWEANPCHMDLLAGSPKIREHLAARQPVDALLAGWEQVCQQFTAMRKPYLLYD
jgi:uncharacterized protein YbbC (DUF1343 family)